MRISGTPAQHSSFRNMLKHAISLDFFTARLRAHNPITFVRYGDGEFNAIFGRSGHNCDGHEYFPRLGAELALTLLQPRTGNYMYAIGPKAASNPEMRTVVEQWVEVHAPDVVWNDSEVFLRASLLGELGPLLQDLIERRVVLVGADHLKHLPIAIPTWWQHIVVPETNAWLKKKEISQQVVRAAAGSEVVVLCAGMLSKVLAWELFPQLGAHVTVLDLGSVFDFAAGVDSRSYARRMPREQKINLVIRNFGVTRDVAERSLGAGLA
jgi:hypothetical protein